MAKFDFKLGEFEGPLDVLLMLIKEKKLDITELSLYEVVDSYIEIIEREEAELEEMYTYVNIAAKLLRFKTDFMLTEDEKTDSAKKNSRNLIKSLLEYQMFRDLSRILNTKYIKGVSRTRAGNQFDLLRDIEQAEAGLIRGKKSDFIDSLSRIAARINIAKESIQTINVRKLSPTEIWGILKPKLPIGEKVSFFSLINGRDAGYIAMTILTVLDMANKENIKFEQDKQFDDVILERIREDEK